MDTVAVDKRDEIFGMICEMSHQQVEPVVKTRLKAMAGKSNEDIKDELLGLIDDIVFCSWTSGFEIKILDHVWHSIGGSQEELDSRNRTLSEDMKDKDKKKALQEKYKWQAAGQYE